MKTVNMYIENSSKVDLREHVTSEIELAQSRIQEAEDKIYEVECLLKSVEREMESTEDKEWFKLSVRAQILRDAIRTYEGSKVMLRGTIHNYEMILRHL